jgi:Holin of 3TMs, for gene-transfer release
VVEKMNLLGVLSGGLLDGAANIIGKFVEDPNKAAAAKLEIQKMVTSQIGEKENTLRTTMQARERVIVAELNQSDNYTKRARPTVVYFGLLLIAFNYCVVPLATLFVASVGLTTLELPTEFWAAWGGIVATWSIGRSAEKVGVKNKLTNKITGNKSKPAKKKDDDWWDEEEED